MISKSGIVLLIPPNINVERYILYRYQSYTSLFLFLQVLLVIAIVFAVTLYRLAIAGALYRAVQNLNGGPSAADFVVLLTGSLIQLVGILFMNKVSEYS